MVLGDCSVHVQYRVESELTLFCTENRGSPFMNLYKLILILSIPKCPFFLVSLGRKPVIGGGFIYLHMHHGWHYLQSEMTRKKKK